MNSFNELPWHDAALVSLQIDRRNPGIVDTVELLVQWPKEEVVSTVLFLDCYALQLNMNFGVVASESILVAQCFDKSPELQLIIDKWRSAEIGSLVHFRLETNSTGGIINIFAKRFQID